MQDQIIGAATAYGLHADATIGHGQYGWIVMQDVPDHPGKFVARFATERPTIYVLEAATLAEVQEMLIPWPGAFSPATGRPARGGRDLVLRPIEEKPQSSAPAERSRSRAIFRSMPIRRIIPEGQRL